MRRSRAAFLVPAILILASTSAFAEDAAPEGLAYNTKGAFAVPETPAFVLVDGVPDEILKPVAVNELSALVSRFSGEDGRFSVPQSLGVEFSPGLLLGGKDLTIQEYRKRKFLYRTRLSVATRRPDAGGGLTDIAVGLRLTISDNADLRMDDEYIRKATAITSAMVSEVAPTIDRPGAEARPGEVTVAPGTAPRYDSLKEELGRLQEAASNRAWTRSVTEAAFAVLGTSADSTGQDVKAAAFAAWFSHARPLGGSGQLLVGGTIRAQRGDDDVYRGEGSSAVRGYVGTNRYKASLGAQIELGDGDAPVWSAEIGGEAFGASGFWVAFSAGWEFDGGTDERGVTGRTSIRYGLPSL